MRRYVATVMAAMMAVGLPAQQSSAPVIQQSGQQPQESGPGMYTMQVNTDIVLTNVVARDKKTGAVGDNSNAMTGGRLIWQASGSPLVLDAKYRRSAALRQE